MSAVGATWANRNSRGPSPGRSPSTANDTLDVLTQFGSITVTGTDVADCNVVAKVVAHAPTEEEAQELAEQVEIVGESAGSTLEDPGPQTQSDEQPVDRRQLHDHSPPPDECPLRQRLRQPPRVRDRRPTRRKEQQWLDQGRGHPGTGGSQDILRLDHVPEYDRTDDVAPQQQRLHHGNGLARLGGCRNVLWLHNLRGFLRWRPATEEQQRQDRDLQCLLRRLRGEFFLWRRGRAAISRGTQSSSFEQWRRGDYRRRGQESGPFVVLRQYPGDAGRSREPQGRVGQRQRPRRMFARRTGRSRCTG